MPDGRRIRSFGAVAAILCLFAPAGDFAAADTGSLRPLVKAGEKAPRFTLNDLEGKPVSYQPGNGKAALLVFWSAFCPLCRELTPEVSAIAKRHPRDLRVIGINLDGNRFRNAVAAFVKENAIPFPVALDDVRDDFFVASDPYGVEKTPTAVLVDASGTVRGAYAAESMRGFVRSFEQHYSDLKKGPAGRK